MEQLQTLQSSSWLTPLEETLLEDIARNPAVDLPRRVLAWARLRAWGNGQDFASCRTGELISRWYLKRTPHKVGDIVVAGYRQCSRELSIWNREKYRELAKLGKPSDCTDVSDGAVGAAVKRLEKLEFITAEWVRSQVPQTKYYRHLPRTFIVEKHIKGMRPVRLTPNLPRLGWFPDLKRTFPGCVQTPQSQPDSGS
jgi:hypothetical protein